MSDESEDYYDDSPKGTSEPTQSADVKTSILPKSFFGTRDIAPGHKCKVEVTAVHDNDVEVRYCGGKECEEPLSESESGEMSEMMT